MLYDFHWQKEPSLWLHEMRNLRKALGTIVTDLWESMLTQTREEMIHYYILEV